MSMASFNPSRLIIARKRRGMTKAVLAERAGVSTRSLNAYENGDQQPVAGTTERLAAALEFPSAFFLGSDLTEPPLEAASFRSLTKLSARDRDRAIGSATLALALARWLSERFRLPAPDVPRLQSADSETAAETVRREWGLGERPAPNMIHLLEAHGVRVFSLAEECAAIDAFSFWLDGVPYVFLNTMKSAERSRMDAAHELGHLVLHWRHETPRGRESEREAQAFGAAFLMPRASILAEAPRIARVDHLVKAKRRWRVAVTNLAYRMHAVGLITDWQYRSLFIEMGEKGYRRDEPETIERETSQVLGKVLKALRDEGQTTADVARSLAVPVDELKKLIFGLVLTSVQGAGHLSSQHERPDLREVQ